MQKEKASKMGDCEICKEGVPEIVYRDSESKESQSAEMKMSVQSDTGSVEVEIEPPLPAFTENIIVEISEMETEIECDPSTTEKDEDQKPAESH